MGLLFISALVGGFVFLVLLASLIGLAIRLLGLLCATPGPSTLAKLYRSKAASARRDGDLQTAVVLEAAANRLEEKGK